MTPPTVASTTMLSLAALTVLALAAPAPADAERPITVKLKKDDDKATVTTADGRTTVDITSPTGISEATIKRTADAWPDGVVVRLRLNGLEHFQADGGKVKLKASVSSSGGADPVRQWLDGSNEKPLDATNPYWLDIRRVGADGKPATAVRLDDSFEMRLPKAFFEGNPQTVTLHWIDFFRR